MAERRRLAAVDLGAESGRVVVGALDGETIRLTVAHRFANRPVWLPDGLHWNLPGIFEHVLRGLAEAALGGPLSGVGVDAWGCDYALLDEDGRMLGLPYHYRDPARTSPDVLDAVHARVAREELYRRTGTQTLAINTVFQLAAEAAAGGPAVHEAQRIALVPDLLGLWLTGTLANELTAASTTGLLEARRPRWAADLARRLGLPGAPFAREVVAPGTELGPLLAGHRDAAGDAVGAPVRTVAGHDTACAFAAAPLDPTRGAVLSSGTWSLLGLELDGPELGAEAAAANLTNERGVEGTTRLLRNVMGLWLVQECRRDWARAGVELGYDELVALAADAPAEVPLFDPDHPSLLRGGNMEARIGALCRASGQPAPAGPGELTRATLVSLACKYRYVLEALERVSGRRIEAVHVVGGGARNDMLCRLTAELLERPVLAGPVEATALGNLLVQAQACGELAGRAEMRALVRASAPPTVHEPAPDSARPAAATYQRFLAVSGLGADRALATAAAPSQSVAQGEP